MRRFSWLVLLMWLGCGDAASDSSSSQREGTGDGELAGPATGNKEGSADAADPAAGGPVSSTTTPATAAPPAAAMAASAPSTGIATSAGATPGAGSAPVPASAPSGSSAPSSKPAAPPADGPGTTVSDPVQGRASVLTAGATDDNRNFTRFEKYRKKLADQQLRGLLQSTDEEHATANKTFAQPSPREKLDVALVIDTTGSMGDEISYLQREFLALSAAIEEKYPNAEQRWSLVLYRDMGDEYVTRWFDFRDDAMEFRDKLSEQSAGGGGDFPEAPDAALEAMSQLAWRTDDKVARLAFWVADAPHHDNNAAAMLKGIRSARELGVHLYPVASSGVDELTEVTMRSAAQLTGGRYLFLTDDSGVGGAHKEPTIPCYFVTKLDKAILRMVNIEMSGVYAEPAEDDIIRTSGEPKGGSCELQSGEVVEAY